MYRTIIIVIVFLAGLIFCMTGKKGKLKEGFLTEGKLPECIITSGK